MTSLMATDSTERRGPDRARLAGALTIALLMAFLAVLLPVRAAAQDGDEEGAFRPACELNTTDEIAALVGATLTPNDFGPQYCAWESGGPSVFVSLDETSGVAINRAVLPGAEDLTVAGREALSSPGEGSIPATVIVALDAGGVIRVQVAQGDGLPADPVAAAVAIAEAVFASGAVLARPPQEESGPSLGHQGPACELVTLDEMREATGAQGFSSAEEDAPDSCSYTSDDFSLLVSVSLTEGELFQLRGSESVDLTIGGLSAVWSTDFFNSLSVDIGGGRLLQVSLLVFEGQPGDFQRVAEAIAEIAVGRLVPVDLPALATAAPAGPGCDLLPVEEVASITGVPFATATDEEGEGTSCAYSTADPANEPSFLIVTRVEAGDPAAAMAMFAQDMSALPETQEIEIAGRPALSGANETIALALVDLDGIAGEDGRVLVIGWFFPPAEGDATPLVVRLGEAAVGNL